MNSQLTKSHNQFYQDAVKVFSRYFRESTSCTKNVDSLVHAPEFKEMMSSAPIIFLIADLQTQGYVFISENIKNILGYSPEEFYKGGLLKTVTLFPGIHNEIVLNKIFPVMFDHFDRYSAEGEVRDLKVSYTSLLISSDGIPKWFLHEATIIQKDEFNKPHLMFKLLTDINDLKKDELITFVIDKKNTGGSYEKIYSETYLHKNYQERLSSREIEILRLINEGKTSNEISSILCLSIHTINTHRKNMLKKLEIKNTVGLLKKTKELGIID